MLTPAAGLIFGFAAQDIVNVANAAQRSTNDSMVNDAREFRFFMFSSF
ncbi:MAG: hypothetical protein JRE81_08630 [Deltaproteobacteria bacterium]|nr:hypothetical protein [Deltaproteobacteria bacterium]